MQTCGGCGGAAQHLIINSLVALPVLQLLGDVWRQRHPAYLIQHRKDIIPRIFELHPAVAALQDLQNLGVQKSIAENKSCTGLCTLAGAHHRFPFVISQLL